MLNSALFHQRAQAQYQRMQAETVSPGQLVLLLYQGCLRFIGRGRIGLEQGDYEAARVNLLKAQDIVAELMGSLDMEIGEIASNLLRLYEYMHRRLIDANIRRDGDAAVEVEKLLRSLLPAWEEAVRRHYAGQAHQAGRAEPAGGSSPGSPGATLPPAARLSPNLAG